LSPCTAVAGGPNFLLSVSGENFVQGSVIMWGSTPYTANFTDHNTLSATIQASDIASPGTVQVKVVNPNSGGTATTTRNFSITAPSLALSPSSVSLAVGESQTMTVTLGQPGESQSIQRVVNLSLGSAIATITDCSGNTITSVNLAA